MEEKFDVLDRGGFIEKLKDLVNVISENKQGCCFGLNGFWGSGKSFVLEKFEEEIKEIQSEETGDTKYFVFHYDCWKYDYYEEPAIAIIAAMLDATDRELNVFTSEQRDVVKKMAWETAKETLKVVASELCKNKVGIDLVEIATNTIEERMKEDDNSFDSIYDVTSPTLLLYTLVNIYPTHRLLLQLPFYPQFFVFPFLSLLMRV